MRIEYDKDADAAYVYLVYPIKSGGAKKTMPVNENIIVDFDENGKMIGVEVLNASKVLDKKALAEAHLLS